MSPRLVSRQRGAALVVGMIMLVLITLMLVTALNLGTTNFRAMTNMQFRSEAIAAANKAIEQVISSPFTAAPTAEAINVDIDNDDDHGLHRCKSRCRNASPRHRRSAPIRAACRCRRP